MTDIASILAPIKEALAAGPTPGPWIVEPPQPEDYQTWCISDGTDAVAGCDYDNPERDSAHIAACHPERMSALIAAIEALQAERDALRDSLATEISRRCASERDCIWQPHCAGAGKCLRPERPFDAALSAQTTKEQP